MKYKSIELNRSNSMNISDTSAYLSATSIAFSPERLAYYLLHEMYNSKKIMPSDASCDCHDKTLVRILYHEVSPKDL